MVSKILLALSLAVAPVVSVSAQAENTFDTFQTVDKYLADFDYLTENSYRLSLADMVDNSIDYNGGAFRFYAFPIYYELVLTGQLTVVYYSNVYYNFYVAPYSVAERTIGIEVLNYTGVETEMRFLALDYIGMSQVIEHDKVEKSNSISIYNSFYKFFTGFFPNEVVAEYHGIFTFVIVAFLLFLVFGFVFFLFRVIRRLVGFK